MSSMAKAAAKKDSPHRSLQWNPQCCLQEYLRLGSSRIGHPVDSLIAATALKHCLILVTRNE